jgi:hypothetical protein
MPLKDDILFYHVPKCAGTSITRAMNLHDLDDISPESCLYGDCSKYAGSSQHAPASWIRKEKVQFSKSFVVLRHPVRRMVSEYYWKYQTWRNIGLEKEMSPSDVFLELCRKYSNSHTPAHDRHFMSQKVFLEGMDANTRILCHETLSADWEKMYQNWNLKKLGWSRKLVRINKSISRGIRKISHKHKMEIAEIYADDFEFLKKFGIIAS